MTTQLQEAIEAVKAGDISRGRRLLLQIIDSDEENESAWLWLARTVDGEKCEYCLKRVLAINPENEVAQRELGNLQASDEAQGPAGPEPHAPDTKQCPYCAETIKAAAIVCRYCGRELIGSDQDQDRALPAQQGLPQDRQRETKSVRNESAASEVGKTCLGVSLGILSAPVILVVAIVVLVLATCAMCYGGTALGGSLSALSPSSRERSPTRNIPATFTPAVAFNKHQTMRSLVTSVAGDRLEEGTLFLDTRTEYKGRTYPDGRLGYDVDFAVTNPEQRSREEMIALLHTIAREVYFNFDGTRPMYIFAVARAGEDDIDCVFSVGIGYRSAETFMANRPPNDLEEWFRSLVAMGYYGDLPGQTEALLAFANDPADAPYCDIRKWK